MLMATILTGPGTFKRYPTHAVIEGEPRPGCSAYDLHVSEGGEGGDYVYACPKGASPERYVSGGAFLWSEASEFRGRFLHPIPIHDRPL